MRPKQPTDLVQGALEALRDKAHAHFARGESRSASGTIADFERRSAEELVISRSGPARTAFQASIVVLGQRHSELVERALQNIAEQIGSDIEVILVDNGNTQFATLGPRLFQSCVVVKPLVATTCSTGRNLAARVARSERLIFLDDDGLIEAGTIEALLRMNRETSAMFIRGRVTPLTQDPQLAPTNYDLGPSVRHSFLTAEGVSCVDRRIFEVFGGFDGLLAGNEGLELCARAFPFLGKDHFLYCPDAVLRHDYTDDPAHAAEKRARYRVMQDYAEKLTPGCIELSRRITKERISIDAIKGRTEKSRSEQKNSLGILTTLVDQDDLSNFATSLRLQDTSLEKITVATEIPDREVKETLAKCAPKTPIRVVRQTENGAQAILDLFRSMQATDLLMIVAPNSNSLPHRMASVHQAFETNAALGALAHAMEPADPSKPNDHGRNRPKGTLFSAQMLASSVSFGSLTLRAEVAQVMLASPHNLFWPALLDAIERTKFQAQYLNEAGVVVTQKPEDRAQLFAFGHYVGDPTEDDKIWLQRIRQHPLHQPKHQDVDNWCDSVRKRATKVAILSAAEIDEICALLSGLLNGSIATEQASIAIQEKRDLARDVARSGDNKMARRLLREIESDHPVPGLWRQKLSVHRWAIVRMLFSRHS